MTLQNTSSNQINISESRRKAIKYLVWEKNGLLHSLCDVEQKEVIASKVGHTGEWLTNILAGRKVILFPDMLKLCAVLAQLNGKSTPWDSRQLFPPSSDSNGPSMYGVVKKNSPRSARVMVNRHIFSVGSNVKITLLEART